MISGKTVRPPKTASPTASPSAKGTVAVPHKLDHEHSHAQVKPLNDLCPLDMKLINQLRYLKIYLPVLIAVWAGLFLDSTTRSMSLSYSQWLSNGLILLAFVWVYRHASKAVGLMMLYGLVIALFGEILFSLVLEMYTYRLGNVPLYVPLGHSIIYAAVYYIVKEPLVRRHRAQIIRTLYAVMILYSSLWLMLSHDLFGFTCMLVILWVFRRRPSSRLFFLVMFFMVAYLELIGTYYQCWRWPDVWFGSLEWMPSANPPSGISVFYFAFDAGCLWCYRQFNRPKWQRMRAIQRIAKQK